MHRSTDRDAMAYKGKHRRDMGDKQEGKEGAGEEGRTHGIIKPGMGSGEEGARRAFWRGFMNFGLYKPKKTFFGGVERKRIPRRTGEKSLGRGI